MTRIGEDRAEARYEDARTPSASYVLGWAARTDVGLKRQINEDSLLTQAPVFAVADGMGGHAAGDRASSAVIERLATAAHGMFIEVSEVSDALIAAGTDIDHISEGISLGAGTTITGVALTLVEGEPSFLVFNIGDSRVYAFIGGALSRVTVDHSVVQELVDAGVLTPEQAEHHPESNVITRALGFHEAPNPDYWTMPLIAGLRILVCSDGLTKEVNDTQIAELMGAGLAADGTADILVQAALAQGGRDNVSVLIVDVLDAPKQFGGFTDGVPAHAAPSNTTAPLDPLIGAMLPGAAAPAPELPADGFPTSGFPTTGETRPPTPAA